MLQYLLNTTAIWFISIVLFDLFFKKESYHGYNRFYLLFTFLLGAALPVWQWQDNIVFSLGTLQVPVEKVITARQHVISDVTASDSASWEQLIAIIYLSGMAVAVFILLVEIVKLAGLYRAGKRSKQDGWTIVETGKGHAPFSFMNMLFVSSKQQYGAEDWGMILQHEQRHKKLLHFADLLLMQLAKIVFWFHPLVYIYNKRLLLVHEYQADNISASQPQVYGTFLIEQALLGAAPAISHSFNRSPIKKRIVMLTRKSSVFAKSKMLVFIPLAMVCLVFFSKNSFSKKFERNGNIVTYNGNKFKLIVPPPDTVIIIDPVSGQEMTKIMSHGTEATLPATMNGKKIYGYYEIPEGTQPGAAVKSKAGLSSNNLKEYLLTNLADEFRKLANGSYFIELNDVVVDEKGKIVFFNFKGILVNTREHDNGVNPKAKIDKATQASIAAKVSRLMEDAPMHSPAMINGNAVPFLIDDISFSNPFIIKDHKVVYE